MTEVRLHASRDFFNQISRESKRIQIAVQYIQAFVDQLRVRGCRTGDHELLELLDYMELFFSTIRESSMRIEKLCERQ